MIDSKKGQAMQPPFSYMLDNFLLARDNLQQNNKSAHWDIFPSDYEKAITTTSAWPTFMRNSLSLGFNDDIASVSNTRWDNSGDGGKSKKIDHDFDELIEATITDEKHQKTILNLAQAIITLAGFDFFLKYLASDVGSPATLETKYSPDGKQTQTFAVNGNDISILYYFYQINRTFKATCKSNSPLIVEIGGGYGGLITKIKRSIPGARCIMLDLPEVTAVQTYYLYNEFPDKKFFYYNDWLERGSSIFEEDFDYLIAPGWMISHIPDVSVDLVINMRSMMEMTNSVISFYFKEIQRITMVGGLFTCFNRYYKTTAGEPVLLKHYPFDDYWKIILSQSSIIQSGIHDLIVQRQFRKNFFPIRETLKSLPPI
ncbi:MAG: putative sugar O-methyltransferase [Magnetococcales bacterium]|nr:putative sugar O-methyltransferase [Magnetococcales bacterium]